MLQEVTEYLSGISTPEYLSVATEALNTLDLFDYTDHEQPLLNTVMGVGDEEEAITLQEIHTAIDQHLRSLLAMHAIYLVEDASFELMTEVARAIYLMQNWEDKDGLLYILEQDAPPEEIFADVVQTVCGLSTDTLIEALVDFDSGVNDRLVEILKNNLPSQDIEEEEVSTEQLVRLKNYHQFMNDEKLIGIRLVRLGYRIGAPFPFYYDRVKRHFPNMEAAQQAVELLTLLLISRDCWMTPTQSFNDLAPTLGFELDEITQIDALMKQQWAKFQQFSQSN